MQTRPHKAIKHSALTLTAVFVALFLGACASTPKFPAQEATAVTFPADSIQYARFQGVGTGALSGQAFMKTRGGDVKLGAGNTVFLDPVTDYSNAWWTTKAFKMKYFGVAPGDSLFQRVRRQTTSDGQGRFKFTGLPAGPYYVHTYVTWETGGAFSTQGGVVGSQVLVSADSTADVILTQ